MRTPATVTLILTCFLIQVQLIPVLLHSETMVFPRHPGNQEGPDLLRAAGCSNTHNYKHPHPCHPGVDCAFVVRWWAVEGEEGWVGYQVTASLARLNHASSLWVALGFSSNPDMGDTDVVACLHGAQTGLYEVRDGYNIPGSHKFVLDDDGDEANQVTLLPNATWINDGLFSCTFHRLMDTGDVLQDKLLSDKHYVLVAVGPLSEAQEGETGGARMLQHVSKAASTCACDVMSCDQPCSCPVGFFYQMLKLHGIVMAISFMLLIPVGAVLSRYYKAVFINGWFKAHLTVMVIGVLWSLVGLALILTHTRGVFSIGPHQILGITVLFLGVLQPMVGFLRPLNNPTKLRKVFNIFHRSTAAAILLLSTVVLFLGVYLFHNSVLVLMLVILSLYIIFNFGFLAVLEVLKRNQKFSSSPPVGYHKVTTQREDTDSEEEAVYVKEEPPKLSAKGATHYLEKALLLLFVVVNLILAGLISTFIFYYDAEAD